MINKSFNELCIGFANFYYYQVDFEHYVLSTFTGKKIDKSQFSATDNRVSNNFLDCYKGLVLLKQLKISVHPFHIDFSFLFHQTTDFSNTWKRIRVQRIAYEPISEWPCAFKIPFLMITMSVDVLGSCI